MKPTLQTVADAVGVSRSTVSNAYSRPDQLSPELRKRILEAAQRLGYAGPHPAARSLRSGRAGAIGVLFTAGLSDAFTDPYAVRFLRGVAKTVERHGTGMLLIPLSEQDNTAALRALNNAVVDGFCVFCVPDWHMALAAIRARGLPVVSAEGPPDGAPDAMFVGIDERAAAYSAAAHVARLGHRRVAVISIELGTTTRDSAAWPQADQFEWDSQRERARLDLFATADASTDAESSDTPHLAATDPGMRYLDQPDPDVPDPDLESPAAQPPLPVRVAAPEQVRFQVSRERLRGIRDAFAEVGVAWSDLVVIDAGGNSRERGAAAAGYALDQADRCTAVLTYSDVLALGVLDALAVRGLRPGRDISVAGFDDIPEAAAVGLTTVWQPAVQRGARVAELLLDPPIDPAASQLLLPTKLVVRSSTGPVERD